MQEINLDIISYELKIDPYNQAYRSEEKIIGRLQKVTVRKETKNLIYISFVKKIYLQMWVANPVLMNKSNGSGVCASTSRTRIKHAPLTLILAHN